jgi:integral membrane protein (TIGR01906 family)
MISALIPVLLVLLSLRLLLTEQYLLWMYQTPGFPADLYGWPDEVRRDYGPYGIRYLLNDAPISYLGDLEIEGEPAFIGRELDHMEDVQALTQGALQILTPALMLFILASLYLLRDTPGRALYWRALSRGGMLTILLSFGALGLIGLSWDFFFEGFHSLFFADGTWQFYRSDTLIRLYPEAFWIRSSILLAALALGGALLLWWLPLYLLRRQQAHQPPHEGLQAMPGSDPLP